MKQIIKNAIKTASLCGYPQYVYEENDGTYTFGRLYDNAKLGVGNNVKRLIGIVKTSWGINKWDCVFVENSGVGQYECEKLIEKYNITF